MRWLIDVYRREIENYCVDNHLSFEKVYSSSRSEGKNSIAILYSEVKPKPKLKDGKPRMLTIGGPPMPITLKIFLENGKLRFEQTDLTRKYLAEEEPVGEIAFA